MANQGSYRSMEEFEREVIRTSYKTGWSFDDLYCEANINRRGDSEEDIDIDDDE